MSAADTKTELMRGHAIRRWEGQQTVPQSPGAFTDDGRYELCLGAALAEAATRFLEGSRAAEAFVGRLAESGTKEAIVEQFVRLGWPAAFAREKIALNDRTPSGKRKRR